MSKKRGLSAEDKRQRMLELLYEKKDIFQLKELERIAPKEKGIVSQSVKEVIQNLVDDSLVDTDKIGTSVYFWAFPSKAATNRKRKLQDLNTEFQNANEQLSSVEKQLEKAQCNREESNDRMKLLEELEIKEKERDALRKELEKYKDCDPELLEEMRKQNIVAKEASNRWTDNIFALKEWCKKKFFIEEATINKQFGIPEELDYLG